VSRRKGIEIIAYHEAGHAVMGCTVGRGFRYCTIEADDERLGHVSFYGFNIDFECCTEKEMRRARLTVEKLILTWLSGYTAEKILTGRATFLNRLGSHEDFKKARSYACIVLRNPEEVEPYLAWLLVRCENLLRCHWFCVEAVAKELLAKKKLGQREIKETIEKAWSEKKAEDLKCFNRPAEAESGGTLPGCA
jgi:hypothetical protein